MFGACKIRLEPVGCPRFACGLAFTFSLHTGPPSTSLITVWAKLFEKKLFYSDNCLRKQLAALFEKMQNATRKCLLHCLRKCKMQLENGLRELFERNCLRKLFDNCLRQDYKEMFSTRLVTNYFQWTMSTMWQIFSGDFERSHSHRLLQIFSIALHRYFLHCADIFHHHIQW